MERGQLLLLAIRLVRFPKIGGISEQVSRAALVQRSQLAQHVKGRGVSSVRRPQFPVREVLERLRLGRPSIVPLFGSVTLTPATHQAQRHPHVDAVTLGERMGHLDPGPGLRSKLSR
jgi:hypothetical protein